MKKHQELSKFALSFLLASAASASFANNLIPKDLKDLQDQYQKLSWAEGSSSLMPNPEHIEMLENLPIVDTMNSIIASLDKDRITDITASRIQDNVRDTAVEQLFENKKRPNFCNAVPAKAYVPAEGETLTQNQLAEKQAKLDALRCRNQVRSVLGGMVHANPTVYSIRVAQSDGSEVVHYFVQSMVVPTSYLHYLFQR
jgi:hypothetical protein